MGWQKGIFFIFDGKKWNSVKSKFFRANRTLQSLIFKDCKARKSLRYIDNLEGIVDTYMKRYHRGIKMSSLSAQDPANALKLRDQFERQYLDLKKEPVKFTIGKYFIKYSQQISFIFHGEISSQILHLECFVFVV